MNAYIKAADKAFENQDYYSALEFYATALEMDSTRLDLRYNVAQSARLFNAYSRAITEYELVLMEDTISRYSEASFWLADVQHKMGNYEEALAKYNLYLSEYSGQNEYLTKKSNLEIENVNWAINEISNSNSLLNLEHLGPEINTPYTEFGAFPVDTALLFSSLRFVDETSKRKPKHLDSKILSKSEGRAPSPIGGDINDSNLSLAHNAFDRNMEKVYYTICDYVTDSYLKCDLYCRSIGDDGVFKMPMRLPFNSEEDSITYTQPTVGYDEERGLEFLIFSSNRPGGKGKMDLYKVDILGDNMFGNIEPLSNLNTVEDEISPYFHKESNILYFSSNGKKGFGGFDVFNSDYIDGKFYGNYNVGSPINSSFNDIYYVLAADEKTSYLSSNRTGSYYIDELRQACCYDIYKATTENPFLQLDVLTFDQLSMDSLEGVTVKLINPATDKIIEELTSLDGINHLFDIRRGRDYIVITDKEGWNPDTMLLSTRGNYPDNLISKKVYLTTDRTLLDLEIFDEETLAGLDGSTIKVVNLSTGDTIYVNTLPNSNRFKVYLEPGLSYEVIASRNEYATERINIDLSQPSSDRVIKKKIYLRKIAIDSYLPLYLYFDNDRPDPGSRDLYSPKAYSDIVNAYYSRKTEFVKRRTARLSGSQLEERIDKLNSFFDDEVQGNYSTFNEFLDLLFEYLKEGRNANLTLKGYTSPLAANRYNLALGQRRVSSIKNEIARYRGGLFMPFLESGQLVITDISFGEELAPDSLSDRKSDSRNSIYSVEASKERRVEIISIRIN
jgi:outer membrane protein OmpA-like peptidoglycan-associated protein/tetratricopeptide (TPR) repeat protein